jgi:hypothetical protein
MADEILVLQPTFRRRVDGKKDFEEGKTKSEGAKTCLKKWSIKQSAWIIWGSWPQCVSKPA